MEDFFARFPDKRYPEDIHRYDIEDWHNAMKTMGKGVRTQTHNLGAMRAFFNWMISHGHINYNPATIPRQPYKPVPPEKRPLIDAEMLREVGKLQLKPRDLLLVLLPLTTGLRTEGLSKIWGIHFDLKEGTLKVGKGAEARIVPVRQDVLDLVAQLSPTAMWGGRPLFPKMDNIPPKLRRIAMMAGVKDLTVTRLANTYDLQMQRMEVGPDTPIDLHRQALTGLPYIS